MRLRIVPVLLALVAPVAIVSCAPPPSAAPAPTPTSTRAPAATLLTRAEWGARAPVLPMRAHEPRSITIHHTATRQAPNRALADKMRALQQFSQTDGMLDTGKAKPAWADVPYHFYIDVHGSVAEGREVGYAGDTNTTYDPAGHVLIVLEGNFQEEQPTPGQLAAMQRLVAEFSARWRIPAERIGGHNDFADTACPGRNLEAYLPELRRLAAPPAPERTPSAAQPAPRRTILAVGAHAGDMELTSGALLLKQHRQGDRVVLLHLTLGEGGNPRLSPAVYGAQKRAEAEGAAEALGAEVLFGPYRDGELPNDEAARRYVADMIRQVRPTHVITHWEQSIHKDHANAHAIVKDAVLLASLEGVVTDHPPHRGIRGVYYAENWEDADGFQPYFYFDVTDALPGWREAVSRYEFVRGTISSFRYLDYYDALSTVRGAESRRGRAIAFDIDAFGKKRVLDAIQ